MNKIFLSKSQIIPKLLHIYFFDKWLSLNTCHRWSLSRTVMHGAKDPTWLNEFQCAKSVVLFLLTEKDKHG